MQRNGKELKTLEDGNPRRRADFRNAWKNMTPGQRREAVKRMLEQKLDIYPPAGSDESINVNAVAQLLTGMVRA